MTDAMKELYNSTSTALNRLITEFRSDIDRLDEEFGGVDDSE